MKKKEIEGGEKEGTLAQCFFSRSLERRRARRHKRRCGIDCKPVRLLIKAETVARLTIHERGRGGTT